MQRAEKQQWICNNQTRGRKDMSSIETTVINELIIAFHRLTQEQLCIHQDDAIGCFDRIIRNHAILNSRKYGVPQNTCKGHAQSIDKIEFKDRIGIRSQTNYTPAPQISNYMV